MEIGGMKILVTGGAGFIGSHIVEDLLHHGAEITVFDNFSSGHEENLTEYANDVRIVKGDILDFDALCEAAHGMDAISHQAAQLEIIRCIENPHEDLQSNTRGTLNILEAAKQLNIQKVVYASSACVYGQAQYSPQDEEHPKVPNWPYGISKLAAEHYARLYCEYYGIETIGLRYSIVYGPREWYGRVMTAFLKRALHRDPPVVWEGTQERDFVYVKDVARFNRLCLGMDYNGSEIFNVSTGTGTSIRELAQIVCESFNLEDPIFENISEGEVSSLVEGRIRLPSELKQMILANGKACEAGFENSVTLPEGIALEMDWLRENEHRWIEMHY